MPALGTYLIGTTPFGGDSWSMPEAAVADAEGMASAVNAVLVAGAASAGSEGESTVSTVLMRGVPAVLANAGGEGQATAARGVYAPAVLSVADGESLSRGARRLDSRPTHSDADGEVRGEGWPLMHGVGIRIPFDDMNDLIPSIEFSNGGDALPVIDF